MRSDFLFARPSFLRGMASVLDLRGNLSKEFNRSTTYDLADYRALRSDWAMTGSDLYKEIITLCEDNDHFRRTFKTFIGVQHGKTGKLSRTKSRYSKTQKL